MTGRCASSVAVVEVRRGVVLDVGVVARARSAAAADHQATVGEQERAGVVEPGVLVGHLDRRPLGSVSGFQISASVT